jgi:hypothetical protein
MRGIGEEDVGCLRVKPGMEGCENKIRSCLIIKVAGLTPERM